MRVRRGCGDNAWPTQQSCEYSPELTSVDSDCRTLACHAAAAASELDDEARAAVDWRSCCSVQGLELARMLQKAESKRAERISK